MAEITFTGNKKLKSVNSEWCNKFPYLYLRFFNEDGKAQSSWDVNHSTVRGKKGASELATTGNMNVGTFEDRYENAYGSKIEIMREKNGKLSRSLGDTNKLTLTAYNNWAKDNGCSVIKSVHPEWF